jgi:AraC-like DNA-binding protein
MYNFQEYSPDSRLTPWIRKYWTATEFMNGQVPSQVFPGDSYSDLVFTIDRAKGIANKSIFGIITKAAEMKHSSDTVIMFGIGFKPAAITAFTHTPISEFTDKGVELALLETLFNRSYYETLPELQSVEAMIAHTNQYLTNLLPRLRCPDKQMTHAVHLLKLTKGQMSVAELAAEVCLGKRQLERKFNTNLGVSPKMLARELRFNHAQKYLIGNPHKSLLEIAETCGYYDYTHFSDDFKALSGDTPSVFREKKSIFYTHRANNFSLF